MIEFEAIIKSHDQIDAAFVEFPFDVYQVFGKKRVKVVVFYDEIEYRGSLVNMGGPCHVVGLTKQVRAKLGKAIGDKVMVRLKEDIEDRIVEIPKDLIEELLANNLMEVFSKLSFTNRKEFARWVEESKRQETRLNRIGSTIQKLNMGKKNPFEK